MAIDVLTQFLPMKLVNNDLNVNKSRSSSNDKLICIKLFLQGAWPSSIIRSGSKSLIFVQHTCVLMNYQCVILRFVRFSYSTFYDKSFCISHNWNIINIYLTLFAVSPMTATDRILPLCGYNKNTSIINKAIVWFRYDMCISWFYCSTKASWKSLHIWIIVVAPANICSTPSSKLIHTNFEWEL